ncbi:MAG: hydrogenase maturation protease [Deltaproteobacteria bacterium]|nr:hydrogenase maturation protease [Deltaproteobacteria bacterium]
MKTRVIGLGNALRRDDGVGIHVARALAAGPQHESTDVDVVEAGTCGFALVELMHDWDRVVLVDAADFPGVEPGTLIWLDPEAYSASGPLWSVHGFDLATALRFGARIGCRMPREVHVLAVQVADASTFDEALTPTLAATVPRAVEAILDILTKA